MPEEFALKASLVAIVYFVCGVATLIADCLCRERRPLKYDNRPLRSYIFVSLAWPLLWAALAIMLILGGLLGAATWASDRLTDLFGED